MNIARKLNIVNRECLFDRSVPGSGGRRRFLGSPELIEKERVNGML